MNRKGAVVFILFVGCIRVPDVATERDAGPYDAPCARENAAMCGGECANLDVDPNNCGECGNTCDLEENCSRGACTSERPLEFALRWSHLGDMNLHVVRPDGVEIYWDAPHPPIGADGQDGALNYNDTTRQGPERITFHTPVPGEYIVCVNNFGRQGIEPDETWVLRVFENGVLQGGETGEAGTGRDSFLCTADDAVLTYTR